MTTYQKNPLYSFVPLNKLNELSGPSAAIAQSNGVTSQGNETSNRSGSTIPGFLDPEPTLAPKSALAFIYLEANLQQLLRIYIAAKKALPELWEHPLKARFSNLYYRKLYMDHYHFYQQCENHIDIVRAIGSNHISFTTFFLQKTISY